MLSAQTSSTIVLHTYNLALLDTSSSAFGYTQGVAELQYGYVKICWDPSVCPSVVTTLFALTADASMDEELC